MNSVAERHLLEALAAHYAEREFTARAAAADLSPALWAAAGVARSDASSCGRWLRSHRSATLVGKPDRTGVVQWRLREPTGPVAAQQAPVSAPPRAPAPPLAQQAPQRDPAPPAPPAPVQPVQAVQQPLPPPAQQLPQQPWWHPPATTADPGLPGPRWGCGWWMPDAGSAP